MRKWAFVLIALLSVSFTNSLNAGLVLDQTKYSFGEVKEGEIVEYVFNIKNSSNIPIEIISVKPDCGCTVADYSKKIEPNQKGYIKLRLNTKGYKGDITKTTIVKTSDEANKEFMLILEGRVRVPIDISSSNVLFYGLDTKGQRKVITMRAQQEKPLLLQFAKSDLQGKVSHNLVEKEKGRLYELTVECLEGGESSFYGELVFKSNYEDLPEIKIRVRKIPPKK